MYPGISGSLKFWRVCAVAEPANNMKLTKNRVNLTIVSCERIVFVFIINQLGLQIQQQIYMKLNAYTQANEIWLTEETGKLVKTMIRFSQPTS